MPMVSNNKFDKVGNDFLNFIAEQSRNVEIPMKIREICKEFIEISGSTCSLGSFEQRFYKYRSKIHEMEKFDMETKVKMMFATSTPVDFNFLNELKKQATVSVDRENRITSYIANDGNLKLKGEHSRSSKRKSQTHQQFSSNEFNGELNVEDDDEDGKEEDMEDKSKESIDSSSIIPLDNNPCSSVIRTPEIQRADPSNKVIYDVPGKPSLPILLKIKPEAIQNKTHSENGEENSNLKFDKVDEEFMKFIAEKSENAENPLNMNQLYGEFVELSGSPCSVGSLGIKFRMNRSNIHELENYDMQTKVKMLFATSTPVDSNFLYELKKQANVEVDEKDRITSYIANDRILKLKGDHSRSYKHKLYYAERRKSGMHQKRSSINFKEKEEESDVDDEDEDDEEENLDDKSNKTIMSSGRVSKKRLFFDFSKDADDDEHESSTKKKTKKVSKSKPSNEVIYDGPGVPSLPIPLKIKPEAIQYQIHPEYQVENKPIPFVQYNVQLQLEHRERLIDDDVEFENTQFSDTNQHNEEVKMEVEDEEVVCDTPFVPVIESTSSDEFLKLLKNLVKSLGSKLLHDLKKDIKKAMATLRNENRKILFKEIEISLRTALATIIKSAKPKGVSPENTESLKGFLMLLNMIALNNSSLTVIQQEIQEAIEGLSDEDKTISIKNIRIVLESLLLFVTA